MNRVTLIGNLGKDVEVKSTNTGLKIAKLSVATSDSKKDKSGNWTKTTEWHNVTAFGDLAEKAGALKKGNSVFVEGKITTKSYEKDGEKKSYTEIVANDITGVSFLKSADKSGPITDEDIPF